MVVDVILIIFMNRQTKVNDNRLDTVLFPKHKILKLDISMDDIIVFKLGQSFEYTSHDLFDFLS